MALHNVLITKQDSKQCAVWQQPLAPYLVITQGEALHGV